jgi:hypothetical protein
MKLTPTLRLKRLKRAAVLAGVGALVAGATLLGTSQAHALTILGSDPGGVTLSPASGSTTVIPTYTASACPTGYQGSGTLYISNLDSTAASPDLDELAPTNNSVASSFSGTDTYSIGSELSVFPDLQGTTAEIVVKCTSGASNTGTGIDYYQDTFITFSADGTTYTTSNTAPAEPITTTTTLTASPNPAVAGEYVTLTATVTGSTPAPTGTVTFNNGTTVIGTANTALVNGVASVQTQFPASGTESLTATYTPTTGTEYQTSTGSLSLPVGAAPANSGIIPLAVSVPASGTFTLTVPTTSVSLTVSSSNATGSTTGIVVSDSRNTYPGWSVTGQDSAWTGTGTAAGGTISGDQLGWTPTDTALAPGVTLGSAVAPGSSNPGLGDTPEVLASAVAGLGNGYGTSTLGANLNLLIPATAPAGPYTSGLTISAVTSNP